MADYYRSNAQLAKRVRTDHDHAAFATLVDRHKIMLRTLRRDYGWAPEELGLEWDDLLQEALLGMWAACETYDPAWGTLFSTYAEPIARRRIGHAIRAARTQKARMLRDADNLDRTIDDHDGCAEHTLAETIPAPDYWQPEVMSEIRHELRVLSSELTQGLSSVEREALGRIMLDEYVTGSAVTRLRHKASAALGYQWRTVRNGRGRPATHTDEAREKAVAMYEEGRTQADIGRALGASQGTVSGWVRGHKRAIAA